MAETIDLGIVGIKNCGEYNAETHYEKLNVVTYQGSSYCALQDTIGNLPTDTDYWQLYAAKGDTGATGATGATGPIGPTGPKGDPSGAPLVASSVSEMIDTTRVYVNTTDGKWYYYNGATWQIGGTYQATEDSGSVDYLLDHGIKDTSIELLNYKNSTQDRIISDNTGTLTENSTYCTTDYIYCEAGVTYKITGQARRFLGYNLDKSSITTTYESDNQTNYEYTPSENGYFRFSYLKTHKYIKVNKVTDVQNNKLLPENIIKNDVILNNKQIKQIDDNFCLNKMLNNFTKNYTPISLDWTQGHFMDINLTLNENANSKYATYTIDNTNINNVFRIVGKSKVAVKPFIFVDVYGNMKFTPFTNIDEDIDIIFTPNEQGTLYINSYTTYDDTILYVLDNLSLNVEAKDILNNKKYCACGDSFTAGDFQYSDEEYTFNTGKYNGKYKVYPYIIGDRCNMNVVNLAVGGMTLTDVRPTNSFTYQEIYKNIPSDTDYITLKFGINDSHQHAPIGTINDDTISTFYGAWNIVMNYIIENYPDARIGIIVSNGLDNTDYANATINIAKKYGVPYLNEATGENEPLLIRSLRSDVDSAIKTLRNNNFRVAPNTLYPNETNMHPNVKCHYLESEMIEHFLRRL